MPARVAEPGHPDANAGLEADPLANRVNAADNLMSWHNGKLGIRQFAVDDVEIGAANAASLDPHANLTRSGRWLSPFFHHEPFVRPMQDHGAHRSGSFRRAASRTPTPSAA